MNGKLVHKDSLGNKFYQDKSNSYKRWVLYAPNLGPDSLPTFYHNWLHNTSNTLDPDNDSEKVLINNIKNRAQKHISTHKTSKNKGYQSWNPK